MTALAATRLPAEAHQKANAKKPPPYRVLSVRAAYLKLLQHIFKKSVSINRAICVGDEGVGLNQPLSGTVGTEEASRQTEGQLQEKNEKPYSVGQILRRITTRTRSHYVLHQYGFGTEKDTVKPPEHLQAHFWMLTGAGKRGSPPH